MNSLKTQNTSGARFVLLGLVLFGLFGSGIILYCYGGGDGEPHSWRVLCIAYPGGMESHVAQDPELSSRRLRIKSFSLAPERLRELTYNDAVDQSDGEASQLILISSNGPHGPGYLCGVAVSGNISVCMYFAASKSSARAAIGTLSAAHDRLAIRGAAKLKCESVTDDTILGPVQVMAGVHTYQISVQVNRNGQMRIDSADEGGKQ